MADLRQEVWVKQLLEKFYPDSSFLSYVKDFSAMVDNHAINFADAGLDPKVLINGKTYPIAVIEREDTPIRVELDVFETENTLGAQSRSSGIRLRPIRERIDGTSQYLRSSTGIKAAHAYAPNEDTDSTPVILTSGDVYKGRKRLSIEDILNLKERFDNQDVPLEQRYLVLHPSHVTDLILLDTKSFKDIADVVKGEPKRLAGFNVLQFSKTPFYDITGKKKTFGAINMPTDTFSSFAFQSGEVMKADGKVKMYATKDDPKERATIVGFEKRFIALPLRNKGIGAIVSTNA